MGFLPVVAPLLEIQRLPMRLPEPAVVQAVLVTSGNAIDPLPPEWHDRLLLTVGDTTARRARDAGFMRVESADGDAAALAALTCARCDPRAGALLLVSGKGQGRALVAALRDAGFRVHQRVAYAAVPVSRLPAAARAPLERGDIGTVLFFSAETARQFIRLIGKAGMTPSLAHLEAITIGALAGVALRGVPWSRIRVASQPTQNEMLALLR